MQGVWGVFSECETNCIEWLFAGSFPKSTKSSGGPHMWQELAWEHTISGACPTLKLVELVCLDLAKDKASNLEQGRCRTKRIEQTMKWLPLQRWRKNGCICNSYSTLWPILIVTWHLLYLLLQRGTFQWPCASHAPKLERMWPERETETWHVAGDQCGWLCSMMELDWY